MNKCKLSFIIPNYNSGHLITKCLERIYGLGMEESCFEIIVVDDCSTDNSAELIDKIAQDHSNLIFLRQLKNNRQGAARNRGLDIASGEYITFVDADDFVGEDVAAALNEALDIKPDVYCGISKDFSAGKPEDGTVFKIVSDIPVDKIYSGYCFCSKIRDFAGNNGTPWGYFFRLEYVKEYGKRMIEGHLFEETDWIAFYFLKAKSVFYSSKVLYYYYHNPSSVMMSNMGINHIVDSNALACRLMRLVEDFKDSDPDFVKEWNYCVDKNLLSRGIRLRFLMKFKPNDIRTYFRDMPSEDLNYLKKNYRGNKGREFFFRHKYLSICIFSVICQLRVAYRKIMHRGPEVINFYM